MDKELIRKTEATLNSCFTAEKTLLHINESIEILEKHNMELNRRIRETDVNLPTDLKSMNYSNEVQTSRSASSYIESATIRAIEDMEKEVMRNVEKIYELEADKRQTELELLRLEIITRGVDHEGLEILRLRHRQRKTYLQIGMNMHMSQDTARRKHLRIIQDIVTIVNI